MKLKDALEDAEAPGVGSVDVTSPGQWVSIIAGSVALIGGFGVASFIVSQAKGTGIFQSAKNQANSIENQFAGGM